MSQSWYRRLATDDREPMPAYQKHPIARFWQLHWHKPYVRLAAYAFLSFSTLWILFHTFSSNPELSRFPPEAFEDVTLAPPHIWAERARKVKEAFLHGYHGYEHYAWTHDELKPLSNRDKDNFNGWGVTLYDSLDTMLLMGLNSEYERAVKEIEKATYDMEPSEHAPYFETTIRYLGGLLSAHALRPNDALVRKVELLADKLDSVFHTESGFPLFEVNPTNGEAKGGGVGILAEIASLQLEYTYLAKVSGKKKYYDRAHNINRKLYQADLHDTAGMFPIGWNLTSGQPHDMHLSVGAAADSAHEYLLKQYLLTGQTEKEVLEMYLRATTHIITNLLYLSPTRHLLYVTDTRASTFAHPAIPTHVFEHLSCFLPGLFALGAHILPLDDLASLGIDLEALGNEQLYGPHGGKSYSQLKSYNLKDLHMWVANGLTQTCWLSYADQPSGLGPDEILFQTRYGKKQENPVLWFNVLQSWKNSGARGIPPGVGDKKPVIYTEQERRTGKGQGRDYLVRKPPYLLRPETLESIYLLWKTTGDARWRNRGWEIFKSIVKETWTDSGFASVRSVEVSPAPKEDDMPSYFYAETLKYLYLMFIDEDPIPLDQWIFNTEAHPFPRIEWTAHEKQLFDIR